MSNDKTWDAHGLILGVYCVAYTMVQPLGGVPVMLGPFGTTAGDIFLFPMLYILSDVLSEVFGYHASRRSSLYAGICAVGVGIIGWVSSLIASDKTLVLAYAGGVSLFSALYGSLVFYVGDWINDIVFAKIRARQLVKWPLREQTWSRFTIRSVGSSAVGRLFDVLLCAPAFGYLWWVKDPSIPLWDVGKRIMSMDWALILKIQIGTYLVQMLYELVLSPLSYWVTKKIRSVV